MVDCMIQKNDVPSLLQVDVREYEEIRAAANV